jgi:hypothetical protein
MDAALVDFADAVVFAEGLVEDDVADAEAKNKFTIVRYNIYYLLSLPL